MQRDGQAGVLPEAGALQDPPLELESRLVEPTTELRVLHEPLERRLQLRRRPVASVVDEVDRPRPAHDVNGCAEDEEDQAHQHAHEVVLEVEPEVEELIGVGPRRLQQNRRHQRDQQQGEQVGDQVMVPQLHVLEIDALQEVRQPPALPTQSLRLHPLSFRQDLTLEIAKKGRARWRFAHQYPRDSISRKKDGFLKSRMGSATRRRNEAVIEAHGSLNRKEYSKKKGGVERTLARGRYPDNDINDEAKAYVLMPQRNRTPALSA